MKKILDSSPKLYAISGLTSQYMSNGDLQAYISKYGVNPVFGPVSKVDLSSGWKNAYEFSFLSKVPTPEQELELERLTITCKFEYRREVAK